MRLLSLKTCLKAGLKAAKKSMEIYPRRSGQKLFSKSYQIPLNRVHLHLESVHFCQAAVNLALDKSRSLRRRNSEISEYTSSS